MTNYLCEKTIGYLLLRNFLYVSIVFEKYSNFLLSKELNKDPYTSNILLNFPRFSQNHGRYIFNV